MIPLEDLFSAPIVRKLIQSLVHYIFLRKAHSILLPISSYRTKPSLPQVERTFVAPPCKFGPRPKALGVEGPRRILK
ncbi:hypothetical protein CDAR_316191 [Caerostris darwini]|uniref:Uncharacterized protein n=1 Tax=Caerostris darwini TaxID=1538125 RepID=A0AAV4Q9Q3_9ARAC|nr:hypothetical protein CDAR_316191 [Caerostris darwini]